MGRWAVYGPAISVHVRVVEPCLCVSVYYPPQQSVVQPWQPQFVPSPLSPVPCSCLRPLSLSPVISGSTLASALRALTHHMCHAMQLVGLASSSGSSGATAPSLVTLNLWSCMVGREWWGKLKDENGLRLAKTLFSSHSLPAQLSQKHELS